MRIVNFSADVNSQIRNSQLAHQPKQVNEQATQSEHSGESPVVQEASGEAEEEQATQAKKKNGKKKKSASAVLPDEGGVSDEA